MPDLSTRSLVALTPLFVLTLGGTAMGQISPKPEQIQELLRGPADTPVVMVNLLRFKPQADAPDTGSTGAEAYARYGEQMIAWVESQGGRLIWSGRVDSMVIGETGERFDMVALVEYPSRQEFVRIASDPRVEAYAVHRRAGLEMQWLIATTEVGRPGRPEGGAAAAGAAAAAAAPVPADGTATAGEIRPGVLRTPDERFANLPGFDFVPRYATIDGFRVHYLDEGPRDGEPILLLHGEPTWSYLYRKMIPVLVGAGYRCIVPDLVGFGRSDKPVSTKTHTYAFHVGIVTKLVEALDLERVTFFGQDWGGLIGLRVVAENEERFARVVVSNTGLPVGDVAISEGFMNWKRMSQAMLDRGDMPIGSLVARSTGDPSVEAAYDAPFPEPRYKAGPLILPQLVPVTPEDPARAANLAAWAVLGRWQKPFLTAFGSSDPITAGGDRVFQSRVPGAAGQPHTTVAGAGHFIQESHGEELARIIADFVARNPVR